jgi:hypothetical protein
MSQPDFMREHLAAALELGSLGWQVFPLWGKTPAIPNPHPKGSLERKECHGECGRHGHGLYDGTTDPVIITYWWGFLTRGANIGARVPENGVVVDVDPQNGGHESLALLLLDPDNGPLPETLTTVSGRGTGGAHYFYRRPPGKLTASKLGPGIDLKYWPGGYTVHPPSCHPDSGKPYTYIDVPIVEPPQWLIDLIVEPEPVPAPPRSFSSFWSGSSIADDYSAVVSWRDVLEPHGWTCVDADPDSDGAIWLRPGANSACSATIRHGLLFVYSTETAFTATEPSNPKGYTKFRAYALLNHDGDMSAAAKTLRGMF